MVHAVVNGSGLLFQPFGKGQLLQKKLRTIKVTIKGGYKLFLMPTK